MAMCAYVIVVNTNMELSATITWYRYDGMTVEGYRRMFYIYFSNGKHYQRYAWYFGKWFIRFKNYSKMGRDYKSTSHSIIECRHDHPQLQKVPVGFEGFHHEDYHHLD